jgi:hypothetical protein
MPFTESKKKALKGLIMGKREEAFENREGTLQWNMSVVSRPGITQKTIPGVPAQKTTLDAGSCQPRLEGIGKLNSDQMEIFGCTYWNACQ